MRGRGIAILVGFALLLSCKDFGSPPAIPIPELTVLGDTVNEGEIAEFEIELSIEAPRPVTVVYTFVGITATDGLDFIGRVDTATLPASDGTGHAEDHLHVGLQLLDDDQIEPIERVALQVLSATNATVVESEAVSLILDNDGLPVVSIRDTTVNEGTAALFVVHLNKVGVLPVIFDFGTVPGSASASDDYTSRSGRDTIQAGETSKVLQVTTVDDSLFESSEQFTVRLSNLVNGNFLDSVATGTILDNDAPSFETRIKPILQTRCAIDGCHGGTSAEGGLSLGTVAYQSVLHGSGNHGAVVVPFDAGSSSLYYKTTTSPQYESRMPPGGPYLPTTDIAAIRDWINAGGPDN